MKRGNQVFVPGDYPIPPTWLQADNPWLRVWACGHARHPEAERSPRNRCPACAEQQRLNRNHWAALVAAIVLVLLLACAAAVSR